MINSTTMIVDKAIHPDRRGCNSIHSTAGASLLFLIFSIIPRICVYQAFLTSGEGCDLPATSWQTGQSLLVLILRPRRASQEP